MSNELERRIAQLENEVRRLRAREDALATFNQYPVSYTHLRAHETG